MSTQTGSCLCGNIKIEFTDAPIKRILCHCLDCRKITGCHYSDNGVVVDKQFQLISGKFWLLSTYKPSCWTTGAQDARYKK